MSYSVRAVETVEYHLCSLWCAISTHTWAFSRKSDIKLQSIIINTADSTGNQGEKMSLWGTHCFFESVVLTLLEHVIDPSFQSSSWPSSICRQTCTPLCELLAVREDGDDENFLCHLSELRKYHVQVWESLFQVFCVKEGIKIIKPRKKKINVEILGNTLRNI